ncbi:sodium:calcium antiporter [Phyllobacterium sp. K27]
MFDFSALGLWLNLALFSVAAACVWFAGVRITRYANVISQKTGLGQALIGLLLLGGVTSLPELAVSLTASFSGKADLAVNSILGGIAMQVAILAVADALTGKRALTSIVPDPVVIFQGSLKILLLSIVSAALIVGDYPVLNAGIWMWLLALVTSFCLWALSKVQGDVPWIPAERHLRDKEQQRAKLMAGKDGEKSLRWAACRASIAGAVIVIAGYVLARTGDEIAQASGLGQSFIGAVLVAIATSLPELSTVLSAARAGLYTMAMSDIFGTNLFDLSFLFLIDISEGSQAVMNGAGRFESLAAMIGITVTAIFLAGLSERRDRTILGVGYDSFAVTIVYLAGLVGLFFLRQAGGA